MEMMKVTTSYILVMMITYFLMEMVLKRDLGELLDAFVDVNTIHHHDPPIFVTSHCPRLHQIRPLLKRSMTAMISEWKFVGKQTIFNFLLYGASQNSIISH